LGNPNRGNFIEAILEINAKYQAQPITFDEKKALKVSAMQLKQTM